MAARLSPSRPESVPATAAVMRPAETPPSMPESKPRVVSVSPSTLEPAHASRATTIHAPTLGALDASLDQLRQLAQRFETMVNDGRAQEAQSTKSSRQLQERLRLSARMLRAFQAQIDRVESTLKSQQDHERELQRLDAAIERKFATVQVQLETSLQQFIARLDQASDAALRIHEQRLTDEARGRTTNDLSWLTSTMRDVTKRMEQLAAAPPASPAVASAKHEEQVDVPDTETMANAPLKFQRYAVQAQG
jgi:hypothetical protein